MPESTDLATEPTPRESQPSPKPAATQSATATRSPVPQPVTPVAGAEIEARTAEFTWTAVPEASAYTLQIAPEADFAHPYFDADVGNNRTLSVYDVIPEDESTCFWRVRALLDDGPAAWSGVAHFVASPDPVVQQANASLEREQADVPIPTSPTKGAPVDGHAAMFKWTPVPGIDGYEIQIAPSTDFEELAANVPVRGTNVLTLYSMLPENGASFFWRVRGIRPNGSLTEWSDPAPFAAAADEDVIDFKAEQERKEQARAEEEAAEREATAAARAEAASPVLSAQTSPTFAYTVAYLAIFTFIATIYLISTAV
jgi:hypothetical protein